MYLPAGFSGMCVRKEVQGKGYHKETDPAGQTGAGRKSAFEECKTSHF